MIFPPTGCAKIMKLPQHSIRQDGEFSDEAKSPGYPDGVPQALVSQIPEGRPFTELRASQYKKAQVK
jgi:hypothetical protein